ncbi:hypothetical protein WN51_03094 [Melipona quadrifasciata]|uniref:Uncharacterized protein n=1 Tax=Melipona quadrifasciata TaxID=166423 RepID=A0A0N0U4M1_9HYME|nr:hypothetical protein WN51_03094 [Melipona quadrifasciata]
MALPTIRTSNHDDSSTLFVTIKLLVIVLPADVISNINAFNSTQASCHDISSIVKCEISVRVQISLGSSFPGNTTNKEVQQLQDDKTSLPRLRRRQTHPELLYNYNRKQHIQNIHHYRETDMLHMLTRRSHCKPMPKYRKPKQIQPISPHTHKSNLTYRVHSHDYVPETERQIDTSTNNEIEPSTIDSLDTPEPRKEKTNNSKTNKTGNKKALSSALKKAIETR